MYTHASTHPLICIHTHAHKTLIHTLLHTQISYKWTPLRVCTIHSQTHTHTLTTTLTNTHTQHRHTTLATVVQEVEESFSNRKVSSSIPTPPHQVSNCSLSKTPNP